MGASSESAKAARENDMASKAASVRIEEGAGILIMAYR